MVQGPIFFRYITRWWVLITSTIVVKRVGGVPRFGGLYVFFGFWCVYQGVLKI